MTDELALPVWFDELGPVAAAGLTAWRDIWEVNVFAVPSLFDEQEVWVAALDVCAEQGQESLQLLVFGAGSPIAELAVASGFTASEELSGTSWMDAGDRPPVAGVEGFIVVDRCVRAERPHPMVPRNGERVEERLRQCSMYDPTLDLAVVDALGAVAGYALFWLDPLTLVGLVEPVRVEDAYQRRGLARMLLASGLDRLARRGAARMKVGFETDGARSLYLGSGFTQTSQDRLFVRLAHPDRTA